MSPLVDALLMAPGRAKGQVLPAEAVAGGPGPTGAALVAGRIGLEHAQVIRRALGLRDGGCAFCTTQTMIATPAGPQ